MKRTLLFLTMVLVISASPVRAEISLDAGPYSDDFSTAKYQSDSLGYDATYTFIPATSADSAEGNNVQCLTFHQTPSAVSGSRPYVDYGFTRSDASKPGAITFDALDYASGDASWVDFCYDCDYAASLGEQWSGSNYGTLGNITNLIGGNPGIGHIRCRLTIPTGAKRMYIRFGPSGPNGTSTDYRVGIDNLFASKDGNELNGKNIIVLTKEKPTYSTDYNDLPEVIMPGHLIAKARWETESYAVTGTVMQRYGPGGYLRLADTASSITYKFAVPGDTNQVTVHFKAYENASGDNSWMGPQVLDEGGTLIYSNNITNIAGTGGGSGSFTVNLPKGSQAFSVKFVAFTGSGNAVDEGICPYISGISGYLYSLSVTANNVTSLIDINADGKVNMKDLSVLAGNWLQSR